MKRSPRFDDLPDFLHAEILHRLPLISAHRSKLVCQRWLSVISEPYFIDLFRQNKKLYSLLSIPRRSHHKLYSDSDFSLGLSIPRECLSLKFLNLFHARVEAASNDLLLCTHASSPPLLHVYYFLVCNPVTREWVHLPEIPYPKIGNNTYLHRQIGFLSKKSGEFAMFVINGESERYDGQSEIITQVLVSNALTWVERKLPCPPRMKNCKLPFINGVPCKGLLFWMDQKSGLTIGVDPFNVTGENPWVFIDPPKGFIPALKNYSEEYFGMSTTYSGRSTQFLGVCRENLRLCQISKEVGGGGKDWILRVWDLRGNEWMLHSQVWLRSMVVVDQGILNCVRDIKGCDPNDSDVIYTLNVSRNSLWGPALVSFNMSTREIKMMDYCRRRDPTHLRLLPYMLQWEPTRIFKSSSNLC